MKKYLIIILMSYLPGPIFAQGFSYLSNARSMAMAGAYSGMAFGAEAALVNPANLAGTPKKTFSMILFGIGADMYNDSFSKQYYDRYNGAYLDRAAKADILSQISDDGLTLRSLVELQGLALGYGPFAVSFSAIGGLKGSMARDIFELFFEGNELNRAYSFNPATGESMILSAVSFSYGRSFSLMPAKLQQFGAGATVKYLKGFYFGEIQQMDAYTLTEFSNVVANGHARLRQATGGSGFAFDLGTNATISNNWHMSLVLQNVFSTINWNKGTEAVYADFELDKTNLETILEDDEDFESVVNSEDTTFSISSFSTSLPLMFRIGVVRPLNNWLLSAELEQGFKDSIFSSRKPRIAMGAEYKVCGMLRFRAGTSLGGRTRYTFSYGLGFYFGPVRWDLAAQHIDGILPDGMRGFALATGLGLYF